MKLAEAAHVLGISLEDVTTDSLNKTYKKLIMAWDPEKSKDPLSKQKYVQITEAYKKLSSVMEGKDVFRGDEQHEIAAFMRMFMDMVGMSESDSLPTAAMTFGMMFGAPQSAMEEWSTDEDGEGDYDEEDDEDDEEEDEDDEEEDDEEGDFADHSDDHEEDYPHLSSQDNNNNNNNGASSSGRNSAANPLWEPQAKSYSPMNLKDQISRAEEERKLKLAKKRADKRKKQKQRKLREAVLLHRALGNTVDEQIVVVQSKKPAPAAKEPRYTPEELERLVSEHKQRLREELVFAVQNGRLEVVERIVSFKFPKDMPAAVFEAVTAQLRKEMPSYSLMHKCITDFSSLPTNSSSSHSNSNAAANANANANVASAGGTKKAANANTSSSLQPESGTPSVTHTLTLAELQKLGKRKVLVLERLLRLTDPPLDLNGSDESGLSVLHRAAQLGDVEYLRVVARVIDASAKEPLPEKRKTTLNLNSRCHKKGWAAIHYAVERNNLEVMRLLAEAGANLQATSATDKRLTPMELAKTKLKLAGSNTALKETIQASIDELTRLIARQKAVEKEKQQQQSASAQAQSASAQAQSAVQTPKPSESVAAATSSTTSAAKETAEKKTKGKDKEKDKGKSSAAAPAADKASKDKASEPPVPIPAPAPVPVPAPVAPAVSAGAAARAEKKKLKKAEKERAAAAAAALESNVPVAIAPAGTAGSAASKTQTNAQTKSEKAAAKKDSKNSPSPPVAATATSLSLVSRDEMMDRLLAMGFREADCLSAISLYGTDFDMAISYLVDRPTELPDNNNKPAPAVAVLETDKSDALQQKKEELRRINRAWNAKAEDEKRKLEQQRRLAEEAKLKEAATPHKAIPDVSESVPVFVSKAPHSAVKETPTHTPTHAHTTSSSSLPTSQQQQKSNAPVHVNAPPPAPQSLPVPPMYAHTHTHTGYSSAKQFHAQNVPTHAHFAAAAAGPVHAHAQMHAHSHHPGYAFDPVHGGYAVPMSVGVAAPVPPALSRASSSTSHKGPSVAPSLHSYAPLPVHMSMSAPPGIVPLATAATTTMSSTGSAQESAESTTETYLTGAIELSAKAKPFVPHSFTPASVPATAPSPAPAAPTPTPTHVGPLLPSTPISASSTAAGSGLNPLLSSPGGAPLAFPSMLSGVGGDASSSLLPPGLGGSLLGGLGSTGSLSSLDGGGLGLGTGSLWSNTAVGGLSGGLGSSVSLGGVDSFAGLGSLSSSNFLSGILGSELGLDGSDNFDFDANMKDLDNLLGSSDFFSDLK